MMTPTRVGHLLVTLLAVIALAGLVASNATTAHLHDAGGYYNQEHDLTSLATLSGGSALLAAGPAIEPTPVVTPTPGFVVLAVSDAPVLAAASRAPPRA